MRMDMHGNPFFHDFCNRNVQHTGTLLIPITYLIKVRKNRNCLFKYLHVLVVSWFFIPVAYIFFLPNIKKTRTIFQSKRVSLYLPFVVIYIVFTDWNIIHILRVQTVLKCFLFIFIFLLKQTKVLKKLHSWLIFFHMIFFMIHLLIFSTSDLPTPRVIDMVLFLSLIRTWSPTGMARNSTWQQWFLTSLPFLSFLSSNRALAILNIIETQISLNVLQTTPTTRISHVG